MCKTALRVAAVLWFFYYRNLFSDFVCPTNIQVVDSILVDLLSGIPTTSEVLAKW